MSGTAHYWKACYPKMTNDELSRAFIFDCQWKLMIGLRSYHLQEQVRIIKSFFNKLNVYIWILHKLQLEYNISPLKIENLTIKSGEKL